MRRERFLRGSAAGLAVAPFVRTPGSAAQYQMKLGHPWPETYMTAARLSEMAQNVKRETGGRAEIQVFANSALGSQTGQVEQVRLGATQLLCMNHSVYAAIVPVAQISALGFAFTNRQQPREVFDGQLGAYIRKEFAAKGLYAFDKTFDHEFREITSQTKPIASVDDFNGFKIRTLPAPIYIELFKALGAAPVPIDSSEQYTALQTHIVDGQEGGMDLIESAKFYEVQKYLSLTNHIWGGAWLVANADYLKTVPADIRTVIDRNALKAAGLQRADALRLNDSLLVGLKKHGLITNTADVSGMRPKLSAYYAHWKSEFGATPWSLLEAKIGKLA